MVLGFLHIVPSGKTCAGLHHLETIIQWLILRQCHPLHSQSPADTKVAFCLIAAVIHTVHIDGGATQYGRDIHETNAHISDFQIAIHLIGADNTSDISTLIHNGQTYFILSIHQHSGIQLSQHFLLLWTVGAGDFHVSIRSHHTILQTVVFHLFCVISRTYDIYLLRQYGICGWCTDRSSWMILVIWIIDVTALFHLKSFPFCCHCFGNDFVLSAFFYL